MLSYTGKTVKVNCFYIKTNWKIGMEKWSDIQFSFLKTMY